MNCGFDLGARKQATHLLSPLSKEILLRRAKVQVSAESVRAGAIFTQSTSAPLSLRNVPIVTPEWRPVTISAMGRLHHTWFADGFAILSANHARRNRSLTRALCSLRAT